MPVGALQLARALRAEDSRAARRVAHAWPAVSAAIRIARHTTEDIDERGLHDRGLPLRLRLRGYAAGSWRPRHGATFTGDDDTVDQVVGPAHPTAVVRVLKTDEAEERDDAPRPAEGPDASNAALHAFWLRQILHRGRHGLWRLARAFPRALTPKMDMHNPSPYRTRPSLTVCSTTPHTTPGLDGLPYLAWARAGDSARDVRLDGRSHAKAPPALTFSRVFPPKGRHPGDRPGGACDRQAAQTWPLTLKNADATPVAAAIHYKTRDGIARTTPPMPSPSRRPPGSRRLGP